MKILSVQNLSKNYGLIKALQDVSFDVEKGSVFGILGPNGSGKTTLLGIVMNVLYASSGNYIWNEDPSTDQSAQRKKIGTLLETPNFYPYLSATNNLKIAASIKGCSEEDIPRVLKIVNLYDRKDHVFNSYSLGMKQRLAIASALLGDPEILVLDEPTNGLDPAGIVEIRNLIKHIHQSGKTIIMASHILDEVEKVCTDVAIIQKGILKTFGTVQAVLNKTGNQQKVFEIAAENIQDLNNVISLLNGVNQIEKVKNTLHIEVLTEISAADINQYCFQNNIILTHIVEIKHNLEKSFLEITGAASD